MKIAYVIFKKDWNQIEPEPLEIHLHKSSADRAILELTQLEDGNCCYYKEPLSLILSK